MSRKVAVFAYNFPHRKTQDFLLRLFLEGYEVETVFAADPVELNIPPAAVRMKLRHGALVHPRRIAERIGAAYRVVPHSSEAAVELAGRGGASVALIAGARVLRGPILDAFELGIVNFHPGLIPEVRGLDAMLWSIRRDIPLGVTAHQIDARVDAGTMLLKRTIPVEAGDTAFDLSERLYETQLEMIGPAIERAVAAGPERSGLESVGEGTKYNRKMPEDLERETAARVGDYVRRHAAEHEGRLRPMPSPSDRSDRSSPVSAAADDDRNLDPPARTPPQKLRRGK